MSQNIIDNNYSNKDAPPNDNDSINRDDSSDSDNSSNDDNSANNEDSSDSDDPSNDNDSANNEDSSDSDNPSNGKEDILTMKYFLLKKNITDSENKIVALFRQIFIDDIICEILLYSNDCKLLNECVYAYPQILKRIELPRCNLDDCVMHPPLSFYVNEYFDNLESTKVLDNYVRQLEAGKTIIINNKKYRLNEIDLLIDEDQKKVSFTVDFQKRNCYCAYKWGHFCSAWEADDDHSSLFIDDLFLNKESVRDLILLLNANSNYMQDAHNRSMICGYLNNVLNYRDKNELCDTDNMGEIDLEEIIDAIKEKYYEWNRNSGTPARIEYIKFSSSKCKIYVIRPYNTDNYGECNDCTYDINISMTSDELTKEEITKIGSYYGELKDYVNMEKYYNMAINAGNIEAMDKMALYYGELEDYASMEKYCKMIMEKYNPKSINLLLEHYKNGC